jgi:hypothetical protein
MRARVVLGIGLVLLVVAVFAAGYWVRGSSEALPVPTAPASGEPSTSLAASAGPEGGVPTSPESTATAPANATRIGLPNPRLTPGAVNTAVTPDTIAMTICTSGWTATVRPPSAYTSALKLVQIVEYGYADKSPSHYQEDHLVPLELGGAPRDPRNLWPEPNTATLVDGTAVGSDRKDDLENFLHGRVCGGTMALRDAQRLIAGDWVTVWQQLLGP